MLLDDVADYLTSAGHGTVGTTADWSIEKGDLPPGAPDRCIAVSVYGGLPSIHAMAPSPGLAVKEIPRFQIMVRTPDYSTGDQKMNAVHHALDGLKNRTINGVVYDFVVATQQPFLMGRDESNRFRFACNYEVTKSVTP